MSVSTEIPISVYIKLDKMSTLRLEFYVCHKDKLVQKIHSFSKI